MRDRKGRTPREFLLERLVRVLRTSPGASTTDQDELLSLALESFRGTLLLTRLTEEGGRWLFPGRRRLSFSTHLTRYIDGLSPVARERLFARARQEAGSDEAE